LANKTLALVVRGVSGFMILADPLTLAGFFGGVTGGAGLLDIDECSPARPRDSAFV
jgi:hypothetical protein